MSTETQTDLQPRPISIGVGACTIGKPVRYNGEAKRQNSFLQQLSEHMQLIPFCPEVGIGLGVPRETIRIVVDKTTDEQVQRVKDSATHSKDYTAELQGFAKKTLEQNPDLCGYILVKGSPSCGLDRVKVYTQEGNIDGHDGMGGFARQLQLENPNLPLEEDGRLNDAGLRESFICRVYVYHDWQGLLKSGLTPQKLIAFYQRYKYLIMAHQVSAYKRLGPLLADFSQQDLQTLGDKVITIILNALKKPATRRGFTNAMQHIRGYLKHELAPDEKRDIDLAIEQYRSGVVPLVVPMRLMEYQFNRHPNAYIAGQVIMQPYPEALGLRNNI